MTSVRAAKSKGSQFEYDCQHSLKKLYPDIIRTAERGYQMQFDLYSEKYGVAIECKRLKSLSWNQAYKYFKKLMRASKKTAENCFLLFRSNRQPTLVMYLDMEFKPTVQTFEDFFKLRFEKHPSTRSRHE